MRYFWIPILIAWAVGLLTGLITHHSSMDTWIKGYTVGCAMMATLHIASAISDKIKANRK